MDLGWKAFTKTWIQRLPRDLPDSGRQHLQILFEHAVDKGLGFVHQYEKHLMVPTPNMSIINCLCNIMTAFFDFMAKNGGFGNPGKQSVLSFHISHFYLLQNTLVENPSFKMVT